MLLLLSPSKTLDLQDCDVPLRSQPRLKEKTRQLATIMKQKSPDEIGAMMSINDDLARMNWNRYQKFDPDHYTKRNAKPSILAFKGHVYHGLNADDFDQGDMAFAQNHLRILSGLYGLLRPLDYLQPYRLEMGTRLQTERGGNLYDFWGDDITGLLNRDLRSHKNPVVVNLASQEYFKAVRPAGLKGRILTLSFKEWKNNQLRIVSVYAKMARGMMCHFAIKNRIENPEDLKAFDYEGYSWSESHSSEDHWVFARVSS